MMFPSHLLATLLVCAGISTFFPLSAKHWALALLFGVAIDLDHLIQIPAYVATHGFQSMTPGEIARWGGNWQGFMHTPWAVLLVIPACLLFASWMPAVAWSLHMFQDFVVATRWVVFGSAMEWAIVAILVALFAAVIVRDHRLHGSGSALREHVLARAAMVLPRR